MRNLRTALALLLLASAPAAAGTKEEGSEKPVLVVCDFDSPFDEGKTGRFVANNFRAKVRRYRLFTTVVDIDRREVERLAGFQPRFDMPLEKALAYADEWLDADLVMWGKVERAGGERLRIHARVADRTLGTDAYRLDTSAVVPNRYAVQEGVFQILSQLTGFKVSRYPELPPDAEKRWREGPNLLGSKGFEKGTDHPQGWEPFGVDWQMGQAHWEENPDEPGKCIVFRMSKAVAGMEGVAYYSQFFDITPGATYRIRLRVKSMAPTVKVFVKYYAWLKTPSEPKGQWREVGRSPLNCRGPKGEWGTHQRDCHPRVYLTRAQRTYVPEKCRVGLYAYWPAGVVYFDDVVFKQIADAPEEREPYDVGETGRKPRTRPE
ncbi:MAG: hypothetical protein ACLF0G_02825 [Candidatus Brocadiia bacterium]